MKTVISATQSLTRSPTRSTVLCIMIFTGFAAVNMAGCTHSSENNSSTVVSTVISTVIKVGKSPFQFDSKHVVALSLVKADPQSGDHWSARVERVQENSKSFYDSDPWQIKSFSGGDILDRAANRTWILHFIDTLTTYRPDKQLDIANITPAVRSNYGLNPPRYEIQWQVLNLETQKLDSYELQIGNPTTQSKNPDPSAEGNGESFSIFPPSSDIYESNGASMAMLDFLKGFSTLRRETLSPIDSDDVDEIRVEKAGVKTLYAQRDGDKWTDEKHRPVKADIAAFLDRVTHLRILQFVDDSTQAQVLKKSLATARGHTVITLTDRYSHPIQMTFAKVQDLPVATVSIRPDAVFDLYPGSLEKLAIKGP